MKPRFRQSVLLLLLCCLVHFCFYLPALAEDKIDVTAAVDQARYVGVPEETLSRMLALGYKYNLTSIEMVNYVNITREAREENLPTGPLVNKIEEGLAKHVKSSIIQRVLRKKLSQCRFARMVVYKTINRWGVPKQSLQSGELDRLSKTL